MTRGTVLRLLVVVPLLAAGLALGGARPASAATICNGGTGDPLTGVIKDSIVVPANSSCLLVGATVRGGVTVETGGWFTAENTEIRGAVSGAGVRFVDIRFGVVRGSVTITGATQFAQVFRTEVRGDVTITSSTVVGFGRTIVRGSATLNNNDHVEVASNTIGANLTCAGNSVVLIFGASTVGGTENCPAA